MGGPLGWSGSWRWVLGASPVSALSRLWNPVSLSSWCPAAVFPGRQDSICSQNSFSLVSGLLRPPWRVYLRIIFTQVGGVTQSPTVVGWKGFLASPDLLQDLGKIPLPPGFLEIAL